MSAQTALQAVRDPGDTTSAVTIASAEWAANHLLRKGGSGYLPRRQVGDLIKNGTLHEVAQAPRFRRRVYLVETTQTVQAWEWYDAAVASVTGIAGR